MKVGGSFVVAVALVAACTSLRPMADAPAPTDPIVTSPTTSTAPSATDRPSTSPRPVPHLTGSPAVSTPVAIATPIECPFADSDLPRMESSVSWPAAASFEDLIAAAHTFIVGDVTEIELVPSVGPGDLPHSTSTILLSDAVMGEPQPGDTISVSQTGGAYIPHHFGQEWQTTAPPMPPDAGPGERPAPPASGPGLYLLELEDDPLFCVGERVALALSRIDDQPGHVLATGPQSRFTVDDHGRIHPIVQDDPAVAPLDGMTIEQLLQRVESAAR